MLSYKETKYRSLSEIKMSIHLEELNLPFLLEHDYKFHPTRKFLLDFAFPLKKIAIEVEGVTCQGGRHQRIVGFMKDCEKYNLAASYGWTVLRIPHLWLVGCRFNEQLEIFLLQLQKLIFPEDPS